MKKLFENKSKMRSRAIMLIGTSLVIVLTITLFSTVADAYKERKYYPEPDIRPNIREDAVWDEELGMYVSGDFVKTENGNYELKEDVFVEEKGVSSCERWIQEHKDSENEIDKAIIASVMIKEEPTMLSSISPNSSQAILDTMGNLPVSCYPELWERICTEPVYRAQKIVAMELFLGVEFGDYGLYDAWGQQKWYELFTEMKNNLSFKEITSEDVEQYGNLLLPVLSEKLEASTISNSEQAVMNEMMNEISSLSETDSMGTNMVRTSKDAQSWLSEHEQMLEVIKEIIAHDYDWVE